MSQPAPESILNGSSQRSSLRLSPFCSKCLTHARINLLKKSIVTKCRQRNFRKKVEFLKNFFKNRVRLFFPETEPMPKCSTKNRFFFGDREYFIDRFSETDKKSKEWMNWMDERKNAFHFLAIILFFFDSFFCVLLCVCFCECWCPWCVCFGACGCVFVHLFVCVHIGVS